MLRRNNDSNELTQLCVSEAGWPSGGCLEVKWNQSSIAGTWELHHPWE
uniref:Uncharacterized protein n=1 Tax=Rhizophora mucronata TaxID=61149 RepID=A0A2P2PKT5_RHIMU